MAAWDNDPVVSGNAWDNDPIVGELPNTPNTPVENTIGQEARRQLGLTGRAVASAVGSAAALPIDAVGKAVNYVAGREVIPNQQRALQQAMTNLGLPEPARPIERFTQGVSETLLPSAQLPAKFIPQVVGNAALGATAAPTGEEGTGAAFGAGGGVVGHRLGKAVQALTPTAEAMLLKAKGVPLTYGQTLGPPVQKLENALAKIPYVGAPIRARQTEALEGWQQATRDAASQGAKTLDEVEKHFTNAYTGLVQGQAFSSKPVVVQDALLMSAIQNVAGSTPSMAKRLGAELSDQLPNVKTPSDFQQLESTLKKMAYRYKRSQDPEHQIYGEMVADVANGIRESWRSALPPGIRQQLAQVDTAYANFIPIRAASTKQNQTLTNPENYSPRMLLQAARQRDVTAGKTRFRDTPQGQLAVAGEDTIGSTSREPNVTSQVLSGLGVPAAFLTGMNVPAAALAGGGALYGTKMGQNLLLGSLPYQQMLVDALRRSSTPAVLSATRDE